MTGLMSEILALPYESCDCVCRITYVPAEYLEEYRASQQLQSDDLADGKNTQQYVYLTHTLSHVSFIDSW